jgi:hypothetical protein
MRVGLAVEWVVLAGAVGPGFDCAAGAAEECYQVARTAPVSQFVYVAIVLAIELEVEMPLPSASLHSYYTNQGYGQEQMSWGSRGSR